MAQRHVAVVGAGAMGASTAWWLSRRGYRVTVFDRFDREHTRGSSHGASRIFRLVYPDPFWVAQAKDALELWRELEDSSGVQLLTQTGSVDFGDPEGVAAVVAALDAEHVPSELLDADVAGARWPGLRFDGPACFQPGGGRISSGAARLVMLQQALQGGARLRWGEPVVAIEPRGDDRARVVSASGALDVDGVVVACGAWTTPVLGELVSLPPLRVTQESVFHFASRPGDWFWPSFIRHGSAPTASGIAVYGLETPGEGVKVAEHGTGPAVDPDTRDFVADPTARARVVRNVEKWMPGLVPEPVSESTCLYTSTMNEDFVIDRIGPVVVVSACSGHGFKFTPLVGRIAADLVAGAQALPRFSLQRFT